MELSVALTNSISIDFFSSRYSDASIRGVSTHLWATDDLGFKGCMHLPRAYRSLPRSVTKARPFPAWFIATACFWQVFYSLALLICLLDALQSHFHPSIRKDVSGPSEMSSVFWFSKKAALNSRPPAFLEHFLRKVLAKRALYQSELWAHSKGSREFMHSRAVCVLASLHLA